MSVTGEKVKDDSLLRPFEMLSVRILRKKDGVLTANDAMLSDVSRRMYLSPDQSRYSAFM